MKFLKFLVIVFLIVSFSGCVVAFRNVNEATLNGISPGMNTEEVIQSVGEPVEKRKISILSKEYELWLYPIERFFAKKYNPLGYSFYEVVFLDGKVREWHKTQMYSQPKYELELRETPEGMKGLKIFMKE